MRLGEGGSYTTPWVFFTYADEGLDAASARLHRWLRARPQHPRRPRPLVLNTWEAVYFDQDLVTLTRLAERAARSGKKMAEIAADLIEQAVAAPDGDSSRQPKHGRRNRTGHPRDRPGRRRSAARQGVRRPDAEAVPQHPELESGACFAAHAAGPSPPRTGAGAGSGSSVSSRSS